MQSFNYRTPDSVSVGFVAFTLIIKGISSDRGIDTIPECNVLAEVVVKEVFPGYLALTIRIAQIDHGRKNAPHIVVGRLIIVIL